jgi:uncharacterized protein YdaT
MPWTGKQFAAKHNHSLRGKAASEAAEQATAMVRNGVPEGEAIATANKHAKRGAGSAPRSAEEHMVSRRQQGLSVRETAGEFKTPKTTAHRKTADMMRSGYIGQGSARD